MQDFYQLSYPGLLKLPSLILTPSVPGPSPWWPGLTLRWRWKADREECYYQTLCHPPVFPATEADEFNTTKMIKNNNNPGNSVIINQHGLVRAGHHTTMTVQQRMINKEGQNLCHMQLLTLNDCLNRVLYRNWKEEYSNEHSSSNFEIMQLEALTQVTDLT